MRRRLVLAALLAASFAPSPQRASAETLSVVVSGKAREAVEAYKTGAQLYLDAKQVGALLGASVYWYPVSGRVELALRGRSMRFLVDSKEVSAGDRTFAMNAPVKVRASRAFVPLSFLESKDFAGWAGHDLRHDPKTRILTVERQGTVGPARAFSYAGRTRVALNLAPGATWKAVARGTGGVDVVSDFGVAETPESVVVEDGVVDSIALKQEARLARLVVKFAEKGLKWKAAELEDPRRVVVDVYAAGETPPQAVVKDDAPVVTAVKPIGEAADEARADDAAKTPAPSTRRRLVVIDPGHGGKDPGAIGPRGTYEKDHNLAAALELARVLRERGDFDVVLTRETDEFVPLSDRSDLANSKEADLFVSLHCNAASNKRENGFEVYSVSETASDPEAEKLAAAENAVLAYEGKSVQDETAKLILLAMTKTEMLNESAAFSVLAARALDKRVDLANRGAKQAAFYVLRGTHAPAILVEMGFVTHASEEAALGSRHFRRKLAEGLAAGIADYAKRKGWLR
ncbi:MAG: N-acetylmuramoyl-L-alanine amidase [Elusimicrobiota bacterium]|nr:N-acetylmuramoyl-L-alanine amidase [Elusimicrobiota bacterium]